MSAKTVLGTPFVPPGRASVGINHLRSALARLHAALAPPPVRILGREEDRNSG